MQKRDNFPSIVPHSRGKVNLSSAYKRITCMMKMMSVSYVCRTNSSSLYIMKRHSHNTVEIRCMSGRVDEWKKICQRAKHSTACLCRSHGSEVLPPKKINYGCEKKGLEPEYAHDFKSINISSCGSDENFRLRGCRDRSKRNFSTFQNWLNLIA